MPSGHPPTPSGPPPCRKAGWGEGSQVDRTPSPHPPHTVQGPRCPPLHLDNRRLEQAKGKKCAGAHGGCTGSQGGARPARLGCITAVRRSCARLVGRLRGSVGFPAGRRLVGRSDGAFGERSRE